MKFNKPNSILADLWVKSGDSDAEVAYAAQRDLAKALTLPLRQGVLVGDIATMIFETMEMSPGTPIEFPLDLLAPGEEDEYVAHVMPKEGKIPEKHVEGDYVQVPTYGIANAIDWLLEYARDANFFVAGRAMEVLRAGFVKKINDDGWHVLIGAGADRGIVVYDADATAGQFTKRLVSLMDTVMRRNAGGNSASLRRGKLTDLWTSPEAVEDIRNWGVDQIDEVTRRDIFTADRDSGTVKRIFGINIHDIDELGENQEYQTFYTVTLSGTLATADVELVVGLDLNASDSFLMPIKEPLGIFEDVTLHRKGRAGFYGRMRFGLAALDSRRVMLGSF